MYVVLFLAHGPKLCEVGRLTSYHILLLQPLIVKRHVPMEGWFGKDRAYTGLLGRGDYTPLQTTGLPLPLISSFPSSYYVSNFWMAGLKMSTHLYLAGPPPSPQYFMAKASSRLDMSLCNIFNKSRTSRLYVGEIALLWISMVHVQRPSTQFGLDDGAYGK